MSEPLAFRFLSGSRYPEPDHDIDELWEKVSECLQEADETDAIPTSEAALALLELVGRLKAAEHDAGSERDR